MGEALHAMEYEAQLSKLKTELLVYLNEQITELRTEVITMFEEDFNKVLNDVEEEIKLIKSKTNIQAEILDLKERILNLDKQNLKINKHVQKIIHDFIINGI